MYYPGRKRSSDICVPEGGICINNASEKKEGAWEFIRFLLSEEYQAKLIRESFTHFPISRKAFADKTEAALESLERQYKDINVEIPIKKRGICS